MRDIPAEVDLRAEMVLSTQTMSLNRINRMLRGKGSFRYTKHKHELSQWVMVGKTNGRVPPAEGRRHLHVMRTFKSERYRLDYDNFVGGCKPLIDACIHHDVILGDEERNATVSYEQLRNTTGDPDWMIIRVYDYPFNKRAPKFDVFDKVNHHDPAAMPVTVDCVVSARKFDMTLGEWIYWIDGGTGCVAESSLSRRKS